MRNISCLSQCSVFFRSCLFLASTLLVAVPYRRPFSLAAHARMSDSDASLFSHESDSPHHRVAKRASRARRLAQQLPAVAGRGAGPGRWHRRLYFAGGDGGPSVFVRFVEAIVAGGDPCLLSRPCGAGRPSKEFGLFPSRLAAAQFIGGLPPQRRYYFEKVNLYGFEGWLVMQLVCESGQQ